MNPPRRSLSASLGSWCVQLVYNPRSADQAAPDEERAQQAIAAASGRALWPAFAAVALAVAAACYALAHFIALPFALRVLMVTLSVCLGISWGARCAPPGLRRLCSAARWPLALVLGLFALSLRWAEGLSDLLIDQPNIQAAVFSGFITLLSVLLIGARSGGRLVPVAAPLVPALSLFGLLCLVAIDGITQACFLLFSGAALYLLCYDHFLRRAAPDLSSGVIRSGPAPTRQSVRGDAPAWALQSVLVSSVWFALFLGGGALLFWPMQAVLPDLAAPRWDRGQGDNGERKLDYSGGATVMELRGGTHSLSDKILLRVTGLSGMPTGTWRGRVYEDYERSLWRERDELTEIKADPGRPLRLVPPRPLGGARATIPPVVPPAGRVVRIREIVVPLGGVSNVIYSSGLPLSFQVQPRSFDFRDPQRTADLTRSLAPYQVESFETQPNLRVLDETMGYDAKRDKIKSPALRASLERNLTLPTEASTRAVLNAVAEQVRAGELPTRTPSQKARAVAAYLRDTCVYSLQGPTVPPTSDATAFFLTNSRRGACDMFASSMALLLREMGVPARVATGFLDPLNPESIIENEDGTTTKILRERDAHAWVEYYVPNFGWLAVDATDNAREVPPTVGGRLADLLKLSGLDLPPALLFLPISGVALLLAGLLWQRREAGARGRDDERARVEAAYATALRLLRRRVPHAPHLAPGEYETRVATSDVPAAAKQEFSALTHLYLAARYGPTPDATAGLDESLARLKSALGRRGKRASAG